MRSDGKRRRLKWPKAFRGNKKIRLFWAPKRLITQNSPASAQPVGNETIPLNPPIPVLSTTAQEWGDLPVSEGVIKNQKFRNFKKYNWKRVKPNIFSKVNLARGWHSIYANPLRICAGVLKHPVAEPYALSKSHCAFLSTMTIVMDIVWCTVAVLYLYG